MVALQAVIWCQQGRLEEAESRFSHATDAFEKLGDTRDADGCREMLCMIEAMVSERVAADEADSDGERLSIEPLKILLLLTCVNPQPRAQ